jgi:homospermidine synthase
MADHESLSTHWVRSPAQVAGAETQPDFGCRLLTVDHLGPVEGHFTTWTPLTGRSPLFPLDIDPDDPWQFRNVLVH